MSARIDEANYSKFQAFNEARLNDSPVAMRHKVLTRSTDPIMKRTLWVALPIMIGALALGGCAIALASGAITYQATGISKLSVGLLCAGSIGAAGTLGLTYINVQNIRQHVTLNKLNKLYNESFHGLIDDKQVDSVDITLSVFRQMRKLNLQHENLTYTEGVHVDTLRDRLKDFANVRINSKSFTERLRQFSESARAVVAARLINSLEAADINFAISIPGRGDRASTALYNYKALFTAAYGNRLDEYIIVN